MSDLVVCTERGIYAACEHIVGIVYLKVYKPMGLKSISLQFIGNIKVELGSAKVDECIIDKSYVLTKSKYPFPIGCHAFPFLITLAPNLGSSMYVESTDGQTSYTVETSYRLIVRAGTSRHLRAETCVYLYRHKLDDLGDFMLDSSATTPLISMLGSKEMSDFTPGLPTAKASLPFSGLRKTEISLCAVLNKPVFEFGENTQLQIYIRNSAHKVIQSISVKLVRVLEFTLPRCTKRVVESVLWGQLLPSCEADISEKMVSVTVPIPLPTSQEFSPTTSNPYVKCFHTIDVLAPIAISSIGSSSHQQNAVPQLSVRVPVPCIVPHNNPFWSHKTPAYWCEKAVVGEVAPQVQVPKAHLGSLHFAPASILQHFGISKF